MILETQRLILRQWQEADRDPFFEMNRDGEVMRYFPEVQTRAQSDGFVDRAMAFIDAHGWGLFALEEKSQNRFIGFTGLARPSFEADFMPCVEIGWRLGVDFWGRGYATEAAKECLDFARRELGLKEIVSFTSKYNKPSRAVMERLGMKHDAGQDFDHPKLDPLHWITPHVLYRLTLS
jgi:RimJ/RimL family protein N-acetyltransferase